MKTLCVIIARGGSKGLANKNTLALAGKPMVAWTIQHAQRAKHLDRVVLSTDSSAITQVGQDYGVEVVTRPVELASDTATVDSAVRHAVETVEAQQGGATFNAIVILYGNVPLRPEGLIDDAIEKLRSTGAHSVQSVCPVGKFHPYWMKKLAGASGDVLEHYQANSVYRRQDLPPVYQLDGGVIAVTRDSLFTVRTDDPHAFLGSDRRAVVTEPGQVIDVDTALDLAVAQALIEQRGKDVPAHGRGR